MLPTSSLSSAAYGLRRLFLQNIAELDDINNIRIGHPADTIKDLEDLDENALSLFFYDVSYDGYPADGSSDNPFYVRLHCLITPVGHKSKEPETPGSPGERDVSKGENELRMIGEVMRILHQQPFLAVSDVNGNLIARLQVVPQPLNLDNLNHIWSTQTDISYRLSVAYEMALAPVPHAIPFDTAPLVGDPQIVARGAMARTSGAEADATISLQPEVEFIEIDSAADDWIPHIAYVETVSPGVQSLHYVFRITGSLSADLDVLIAGKEDGTVKLLWNIWRRKTDNSVAAWQEDIADVIVPTDKVLSNPPAATDLFNPEQIDPHNIDSRRIFNARLPGVVSDPDTRNWQAQLYASREWRYEDPPGSGQMKTTEIKSNSLLFYGDGP